MRGFSGRLPYSWTTNAVWEYSNSIWRGTIKAPADVNIPKERYWAIYDPHYHEFIISLKEKNIDLYDIDGLNGRNTSAGLHKKIQDRE